MAPVSNSINPASNTVRILWRGVYIGKMHSDLWSKNFGCLYRFNKLDGCERWQFSEPLGYAKDEFMSRHGLAADDFEIRPNGGRLPRYYRIRGQESTLKVMLHSARVVDETLGLIKSVDLGLARTKSRAFGRLPASLAVAENSVETDIAQILELKNRSSSQKQQLINARIGQGKFREQLGSEFNWECPVSGLTLPQALRASHIVPWSEATEQERLNPLNGLLLSANIDALFDSYLLTFASSGEIRFSTIVTESEKRRLGPFGNLNFAVCRIRASFLERHTNRFQELELQRALMFAGTAAEN